MITTPLHPAAVFGGGGAQGPKTHQRRAEEDLWVQGPVALPHTPWWRAWATWRPSVAGALGLVTAVIALVFNHHSTSPHHLKPSSPHNQHELDQHLNPRCGDDGPQGLDGDQGRRGVRENRVHPPPQTVGEKVDSSLNAAAKGKFRRVKKGKDNLFSPLLPSPTLSPAGTDAREGVAGGLHSAANTVHGVPKN